MNIIDARIIELHELRIGNLLEYKGDLVKVTSLSCDIDDEYQDQILFVKNGSSMNEKGGWNRSLVNDLQRIPLTPEWLERCGFTQTPNGLSLAILEGYVEISSLFTGFPLTLGIDGNRMPLQGIKYIHELQNLYFVLTGEELTIKEIV